MKKINFCKGKGKAIFAGTFLAGIILSGNVLAVENELQMNTSDVYEKWTNLSTEEKINVALPRTYDVEIPESILSKYEVDSKPHVLNQLLEISERPFNSVGSANDSRFNLAEELDLRVEHQGSTTECWAFSLLKAMETNIALNNGTRTIGNFSERHMDYATSRNFLDGVNEKGFYRDTGRGGLLVVGLAYLTNGQGAVLESDMPFEDNEQKINLSEIDKKVDTIVDSYTILPTIHKSYEVDSKGNTISVKYQKSNGKEYTEDELNAARKLIKEHLVTKGTISTMTGGSFSKFYNNSNTFKATAYNCNDSTKVRDHAITIVGWDDNYPKENFGDGRMPTTDGAYIVLNSYGAEGFNNGYLYVSYEDFFIEEEIYGINSTGKVDYDNIYQADYYGGIFQMGVDNVTTGGFAIVYDRNTTEEETLDSIGIALADYANVEIYVNPNGNGFTEKDLILVAKPDEVLCAGYHKIDIEPIKLRDSQFSIVVKQKTITGRCYYQIEAKVENTSYALVDSDNKSYLSLNGNTWSNLTAYTVDGVDMTTADVCIKAFTNRSVEPEVPVEPETPVEPDVPTEPETPVEPEVPVEPDVPTEPGVYEVTSDKYIIKDGYIMNIEHETDEEEFLNNLTIKIDGKAANIESIGLEENEIITTGMKIIFEDGSEYILIVRGDTNLDGKLTLTDLSKLILHYNEVRGFILEGYAKKGADMNCDGVINLVDVSQMVVLYNSI